jgi:hypothetical protein
MNSQLTDSFVACFAELPETVREQARKSYRLWRDNPRDSLFFSFFHDP